MPSSRVKTVDIPTCLLLVLCYCIFDHTLPTRNCGHRCSQELESISQSSCHGWTRSRTLPWHFPGRQSTDLVYTVLKVWEAIKWSIKSSRNGEELNSILRDCDLAEKANDWHAFWWPEEKTSTGDRACRRLKKSVFHICKIFMLII